MPRPAAIAAIAAASSAAALTGCAHEQAPSVITVAHADYARAFEAALESARADGLEPVVADRELGVIETAPRTAGSFLEPWRQDNADLADGFAHTVNFERRRARIEFVPASFAAPAPAADAPAQGPAIPGTARAEGRFDLLRSEGPVELRAWVYVDRGFVANKRLGTWTFAENSVATDPAKAQSAEDTTTRTPTEWTPIGRDVPYEQRLMHRIDAILRAPPEGGTATAAAADPRR